MLCFALKGKVTENLVINESRDESHPCHTAASSLWGCSLVCSSPRQENGQETQPSPSAGRQSQDLSAGVGPERGPGVSGASASAGWVAVTSQELEESP